MNNADDRITLVYPGIAGMGFNSFSTSPGGDSSQLPLGLMYLGAHLKEAGFNVELLDLRLLRGWEDYEDRLRQSGGRVVGISVKSVDLDIALEAATIARRLDKKVIAGGPHATIRSAELLETGLFDHVITGEGEITLTRLMRDLVANKSADRLIPGARVEDLDSLPFPDRGLYKLPGAGRFAEGIIASRGCPFNCSFCQPTLRNLFGKRVRYRSAENIVDEIHMLKKTLGVHQVTFFDDTFTANKKLVLQFCGLLRKKLPGMHFTINSRVDTFDEEICRAIAEAGCTYAAFGFESGSQRILDFLGKGITVEKSRKAAELCHKYNIPILANILVG